MHDLDRSSDPRSPRPHVAETSAPCLIRTWAGLAMVVFAVALLAAVPVAGATEFKIAVSLPLSSPGDGYSATGIKEALEMGFDEVNQWAASSFNGNKFSMLMYDSYNSTSSSVKNMFQADKDGAVAMVGDYLSSTVIPQALAGNNFQMWQCSASASSPTLSNKSDFKYFFRTIPADKTQGAALAIFVKGMGWKNVAIMASSDDYGEGIKQVFTEKAGDLGLRIASVQSYSPGDPTGRSYDIAVEGIRTSGVRVIVFMGLHEDLIPIARIARKAGVIGADWAWVASEGVSTLDEAIMHAEAQGDHSTYSDQDKENTNGLIFMFPAESGAGFKDFLAAYQQRFKRPDTLFYATLFKDCLTALARGIAKMVKATSEKDVLARKFGNNQIGDFLETFTSSTSGTVEFDKNGDRIMDYSAINLYNMKRTVAWTVRLRSQTIEQRADPTFFSGTKEPPKDEPDLQRGYPLFTDIGAIVTMGLAGLLILLIVGTLGYLTVNREHSAVKHMSLPFISLTCAGLVFVLGATFLWVGQPTPLTCMLRRWIFLIGFELTMSAVAAKAYRLYKIFDNAALSKLHKLSNVNLMIGCSLIILIQIGMLAAFTFLAPQKSVHIVSFSSDTYECVADNAGMDRLFNILSLVYNGLLVAAVAYLAFVTRKAYSQFRESVFIMYSVQNIFLSAVVVSPFLFIIGGDFALGAYYIKALTVCYAVAFTYACLVGRIALALHLAKSKSANTGVKMNLSNDPSSSGNNGISSAENLPGKPQTMHGKYPVKIANKLFETWHTNRVMLLALEGYLALTRNTGSTESGKLFKLRSITFDPNPPSYPICLEIRADTTSYLIQFNKEEDKQKWVRALSVHCLIMSKSSANKSSNNGVSNLGTHPGVGNPNTYGARSLAFSGGVGMASNNNATSQFQSQIGAYVGAGKK
ncbi:hypothetical protein AMAG_02720 [Allomyces macrogynus ATCC 38327]|uniref:G-protein coupled receptors family 3 profile domain-containing protein n=1 Tax=Allomyces macrogynus (strain ATCC 38327) TaxID=578462 RepID=A0A0L0S352_ALLM3|nr:hypothetical protein AMAG_02720 [Allomyces macrogynus ATCC 38327]|eukprot:KNE56953.1 hypothetical protein AMAG_02720 [Allomyces macrogynus ATCC 38327]